MNDEIKEILEQWKIGIETGKDKYEIKVDGMAYTWKELNLLLDYITNLQQENQELNDSKQWWNNRFNAVQRDYEDYKSRIEKAVEYINHLSKEPNVFGHYGIHNDCAKWLLRILNGKEGD